MKNIVISALFASMTLLGAEASPAEEAGRYNEAGLKDIHEGRFADGAAMFGAEVKIWRSLGGSYQPHLAVSLANLGSMQAATGAFSESLRNFEEALSLCATAFGHHDRHTAAIMADYARTLMAVDADEKAGKLLEDAYSVSYSISPLGTETARTLRALAVLAIRRGDAPKAESYLAQVAGMPDGSSPDGEVESATVQCGLARYYSSAGEFDRADALLKKVAAVYARNVSPADPRVILLSAQKGMRLVDEKKYAVAKQYLEDALAKMKSLGAETSPDAVNVENSLALAHLQLGETDEADALLDHVLSVEKNYYPGPNRAVAATLLNRALSLGKQRRYPEAIECARHSVEMYQATVGQTHPETGNALLVYSDLLGTRGGGGREEAKLARARAQTILKQFAGGDAHRK